MSEKNIKQRIDDCLALKKASLKQVQELLGEKPPNYSLRDLDRNELEIKAQIKVLEHIILPLSSNL